MKPLKTEGKFMNKLPKFIYSRSEDRHFIYHSGFPRFIGEFIFQNGIYQMIDPEMIDTFPIKAGDEMVLATLIREAGDFFLQQNFADEKISKFLFCENPLLDNSHNERSFILHTRYPMLLAELHHFESGDGEAAQKLFERTENSTLLDYDVEQIVIRTIWMERNQLSQKKINKLLRRMADWYEAYLRWQDNQDFEDYNEEEIY